VGKENDHVIPAKAKPRAGIHIPETYQENRLTLLSHSSSSPGIHAPACAPEGTQAGVDPSSRIRLGWGDVTARLLGCPTCYTPSRPQQITNLLNADMITIALWTVSKGIQAFIEDYVVFHIKRMFSMKTVRNVFGLLNEYKTPIIEFLRQSYLVAFLSIIAFNLPLISQTGTTYFKLIPGLQFLFEALFIATAFATIAQDKELPVHLRWFSYIALGFGAAFTATALIGMSVASANVFVFASLFVAGYAITTLIPRIAQTWNEPVSRQQRFNEFARLLSPLLLTLAMSIFFLMPQNTVAATVFGSIMVVFAALQLLYAFAIRPMLSAVKQTPIKEAPYISPEKQKRLTEQQRFELVSRLNLRREIKDEAKSLISEFYTKIQDQLKTKPEQDLLAALGDKGPLILAFLALEVTHPNDYQVKGVCDYMRKELSPPAAEIFMREITKTRKDYAELDKILGEQGVPALLAVVYMKTVKKNSSVDKGLYNEVIASYHDLLEEKAEAETRLLEAQTEHLKEKRKAEKAAKQGSRRDSRRDAQASKSKPRRSSVAVEVDAQHPESPPLKKMPASMPGGVVEPSRPRSASSPAQLSPRSQLVSVPGASSPAEVEKPAPLGRSTSVHVSGSRSDTEGRASLGKTGRSFSVSNLLKPKGKAPSVEEGTGGEQGSGRRGVGEWLRDKGEQRRDRREAKSAASSPAVSRKKGGDKKSEVQPTDAQLRLVQTDNAGRGRSSSTPVKSEGSGDALFRKVVRKSHENSSDKLPQPGDGTPPLQVPDKPPLNPNIPPQCQPFGGPQSIDDMKNIK